MNTAHTPERLILTSQDDYPTGCATFEGKPGSDVVVLYHDNAKADARRLVACWNAVEGISTPTLESKTGIFDAAAELVEQRDQLLAELQAAHLIIRNALAVMTTPQKIHWGRLNYSAGVDGEGITRANEREAVITKAGGAA